MLIAAAVRFALGGTVGLAASGEDRRTDDNKGETADTTKSLHTNLPEKPITEHHTFASPPGFLDAVSIGLLQLDPPDCRPPPQDPNSYWPRQDSPSGCTRPH